MKISLGGFYQDRINTPGTRAAVKTPVRTNVMVYRGLDLIAGLLRGQRGLRGILYWAVGSGEPDWDTNPPNPDRRATRLVNEIYRKAIDSDRDIAYDPENQELTIQTTFESDEAVGMLREFGLFGGDASFRPGSGYLINHAIHALIDKTEPIVLNRELRLTLSSDVVVSRALDLIAGLLRNEPELVGIQYWAVGSGESNWDETPPAEDKTIRELASEVYRQPIDTSRQVSYDEDTRTLSVWAAFAYDQAISVLREFGLFGGNASLEPGSGYLLNHQVHPAIDKTQPLALEREFRLTLGAEVVIPVPELTGLTLEAAINALEAANLALGVVQEVESETPAGQVIEQDPPAAELVSEGATIDLVVTIPGQVSVPDVRGLTPAEAATVLADAGLQLSDETLSQEESSAIPGTILHQDPIPGTRVPPGTLVRVVLAIPITALVPDLAGMTAGEAEITLRKAGLTLNPPPHPVRGSEAGYGTVVDQEPAAGNRAPLKTGVTITLAAPWTVEVPDLTGLEDLEEAAAELRKAAAELLEEVGLPPDPPGLALGAQTNLESEAARGTIIGQAPAAGERAPLYGTVDVQLAVPVTVEVPDLSGLNQEEAQTRLQESSLALGDTQRRADVAASGSVIAQEPRAGARVPAGSSVNIVLAEPILVEVPDLIGRTLKYAEEVLASRGLVLGETQEQTSDQPAGSIIGQIPEGGQKVALNSEVQIILATSGPEITGISPNSGTQGTELEAVINGNNLPDATAVTFLRLEQEDPSIKAALTEGGTANQLPLVISISDNAPPGERSFIVASPVAEVRSPAEVVFSVLQASDRLIEKIEILDDFTLQIALTRPTPTFLELLTNLGPFAMLSPRALEELGTEIARRPVGTGPFAFEEWVRREFIALSPNQDYWGRRASMMPLTFRFMSDPDVLLHELSNFTITMFDTRDFRIVEEAEAFGMQVVRADRFYKEQDVFIIFHPEIAIQGEFLSPGGLHLEFIEDVVLGELVYGCLEEPATLDPVEMTTTTELKIASQLLDGLIGYRAGRDELIPHLATAFEASDDGLTWIFKLRPEVGFHDDEIFTAEAALVNFKRALQ